MLDYNTLVLYACYNDKVMLHEKTEVSSVMMDGHYTQSPLIWTPMFITYKYSDP